MEISDKNSWVTRRFQVLSFRRRTVLVCIVIAIPKGQLLRYFRSSFIDFLARLHTGQVDIVVQVWTRIFRVNSFSEVHGAMIWPIHLPYCYYGISSLAIPIQHWLYKRHDLTTHWLSAVVVVCKHRTWMCLYASLTTWISSHDMWGMYLAVAR